MTAGSTRTASELIGSYRADFVLFPGRLVVEVDGFDFHDATPDLAERDKRRDRLMVARGWRVLRYARRDAMACAVDAYSLAGEVSVAAVQEGAADAAERGEVGVES